MNHDNLMTQLCSELMADPKAVAALAASLWDQAGKPQGQDEYFWLTAEQQILTAVAQKIIDKVIAPNLYEVKNEISQYVNDVLTHTSTKAVEIINDTITKNTGLMPEGTRLIRNAGALNWYLFEDTPKLRSIQVDFRYHQQYIGQRSQHYSGGGPDVRRFRLAFPYVVYCIALSRANGYVSINDFRIFYRKSSLKSVEDGGFVPPLPNVHDTNQVCVPWGNIGTKDPNVSNFDYLNKVISFFWGSTFNYYLTDILPRYKTFAEWEQASIANPLSALTETYRPANYSISMFLKNIYTVTPSDLDLGELNAKRKRLSHLAANCLTMNLPEENSDLSQKTEG